ncbi:alpha/beta hydrolase [Mycolicibacterium palauense]|uniref:alpha/beta hydrolase n=1 Tax=Mycolicibacterium palauense TaxID=2034511 RepID=UPI001FE7AA30|nr:alpha/beta hydrolase [Mycolicibacterium palauense]
MLAGLAALLAGLPIAAPATAAPTKPAVSQPDWGGCEEFFGNDAAAVPRAACAMIPVEDPSGARAELATVRIPANGRRLGVLFVNPGGPGASAVDAVAGMGAALQGTTITEHFDLVGFDPRGVGHSTPELRCRTDAELDAWRREPMVDFSPAGVAQIERLYQGFVQQCSERMGDEFLAGAGTEAVARDMDTVRQVLGDDQINYLGFSYGTEIGAAYLQRYSDHVRAMVLDGAIDPNVGPVEKNIRQMAGFQTAFNDYAADCARAAGCPLGQDPAQWVNRYHDLINPLVYRPGATSDARGLSYSDAITGTVNALYTQQYWPYLTSGLLGLQRGTDAGDLLLLADEYYGRAPDGTYRNQQDAFNAVRCVDAPSPTDPAVWAEADRRIREVAPFVSYGAFTGFAPRDICSFWPVPATSVPAPATPAPPGKVVVVSTTHDPATPYQAGVDLAHELDAPLITFEGTQHTAVFNGHECIDTAIVNYLVDGVVPPDGLHC